MALSSGRHIFNYLPNDVEMNDLKKCKLKTKHYIIRNPFCTIQEFVITSHMIVTECYYEIILISNKLQH